MKKKLAVLLLVAFIAIGITTNSNITSNTTHREYVAKSLNLKNTIHTDVIDPGW